MVDMSTETDSMSAVDELPAPAAEMVKDDASAAMNSGVSSIGDATDHAPEIRDPEVATVEANALDTTMMAANKEAAESIDLPAPVGSQVSMESDVAVGQPDDMADVIPGEPPIPPQVNVVEPNASVARIMEEGLMAAKVGNQWIHLKKGMVLERGITVVMAPTFRGRMATDSAIITLVGPAQVHWQAGPSANVLRLDYGRMVVVSKKADTKMDLQLGEQPVSLTFADSESVAAVNVTYFRAPGFDPLEPKNRVPLYGLLSAQGQVAMEGSTGAVGFNPVSLSTGQQWVQRGSNEPQVSPVDVTPDWVDASDPSAPASSLEAGARETLLELLEGDQPFEIALREATLFRHAEVVSLAAQTLLSLGRGNVYFSGGGILSDPKQRAYWPAHYQSLLEAVDRNADSAAQIRESIENTDSTNRDAIFRLLTGYSQRQLVEGGDRELVEFLDSTSMAVRVLALENLERIAGTRLYFRPDQENAVRRAPGIKKWVVRQRKGDIRWSEGK